MRRHKLRRHRNRRPNVFAVLTSPLVTYGVVAAAGYFVWKKYFQPTTPMVASQGSSDSSAASTVTQLIAHPANEVATLKTDVQNSVTGIKALVGDQVTNAENGLNSIWQKAKSIF